MHERADGMREDVCPLEFETSYELESLLAKQWSDPTWNFGKMIIHPGSISMSSREQLFIPIVPANS